MRTGPHPSPSRRRQHFARPVGSKREVRRIGQLRHPPSAPARAVRHEDVVAEVQLRLQVDSPPARAYTSATERGSELEAEIGARPTMRRTRSWVRVQGTVGDLGHTVSGRVLIGRSTRCECFTRGCGVDTALAALWCP